LKLTSDFLRSAGGAEEGTPVFSDMNMSENIKKYCVVEGDYFYATLSQTDGMVHTCVLAPTNHTTSAPLITAVGIC
jgi:hypothetical protein